MKRAARLRRRFDPIVFASGIAWGFLAALIVIALIGDLWL